MGLDFFTPSQVLKLKILCGHHRHHVHTKKDMYELTLSESLMKYTCYWKELFKEMDEMDAYVIHSIRLSKVVQVSIKNFGLKEKKKEKNCIRKDMISDISYFILLLLRSSKESLEEAMKFDEKKKIINSHKFFEKLRGGFNFKSTLIKIREEIESYLETEEEFLNLKKFSKILCNGFNVYGVFLAIKEKYYRSVGVIWISLLLCKWAKYDLGRIKRYFNIANIFAITKMFDISNQFYERALIFAHRNKINQEICFINESMANNYYFMKNYNKGYKLLKRLLAYIKENDIDYKRKEMIHDNLLIFEDKLKEIKNNGLKSVFKTFIQMDGNNFTDFVIGKRVGNRVEKEKDEKRFHGCKSVVVAAKLKGFPEEQLVLKVIYNYYVNLTNDDLIKKKLGSEYYAQRCFPGHPGISNVVHMFVDTVPDEIDYPDGDYINKRTLILVSLRYKENFQNYIDKIDTSVPFPDFRLLQICRDLLSALCHLDKYTVIHRDIKPDNIFITEEGRLVIGDLEYFLYSKTKSKKIDEGIVAGAPFYASPELLYPVKDYLDYSASDIFALGLVLYQFLAKILKLEPEPWKNDKRNDSNLFSYSTTRVYGRVKLRILQIVHEMLRENNEDRISCHLSLRMVNEEMDKYVSEKMRNFSNESPIKTVLRKLSNGTLVIM